MANEPLLNVYIFHNKMLLSTFQTEFCVPLHRYKAVHFQLVVESEFSFVEKKLITTTQHLPNRILAESTAEFFWQLQLCSRQESWNS